MNERHQLEEKLQYKFNNKKLLMTAVTHSSYVKEHCHEEKSNERRPPRSPQSRSSAASDVYKRQAKNCFIFSRMRKKGSCRVSEPRLSARNLLRRKRKSWSWDSICSWGTEKKRAVAEPENLFWQIVWKRSSELFIWMVDSKP